MLSKTIYQLVTTMARECKAGIDISPAHQSALIDVLFHWHKLALALEDQVEELEISQTCPGFPSHVVSRQQKVLALLDNETDLVRGIHLVVDNGASK